MSNEADRKVLALIEGYKKQLNGIFERKFTKIFNTCDDKNKLVASIQTEVKKTEKFFDTCLRTLEKFKDEITVKEKRIGDGQVLPGNGSTAGCALNGFRHIATDEQSGYRKFLNKLSDITITMTEDQIVKKCSARFTFKSGCEERKALDMVETAAKARKKRVDGQE